MEKLLRETVIKNLVRWRTPVEESAPKRLVLTYHRFRRRESEKRSDNSWSNSSRLSVNKLRSQIQWLSEFCEFVSLDRVLDETDRSSRWKVAVTLDDGYLEQLKFAMPVFASQDVPVTLFVPTQFVDEPDHLPWWDLFDLAGKAIAETIVTGPPFKLAEYDLSSYSGRGAFLNEGQRIFKRAESTLEERREAYARVFSELDRRDLVPRRRRFINKNEVRRLSNDPSVRFGGHTESHPNVTAVSSEVLRRELKVSRRKLREWTDQTPNWFAYPYGICDDASARVTKQCGFEGAVRVSGGFVKDEVHPYKVPRLTVQAGWDMSTFQAWILAMEPMRLLYRLRTLSSNYLAY